MNIHTLGICVRDRVETKGSFKGAETQKAFNVNTNIPIAGSYKN